ncbi:MAG: diaminopimelate decarboxylase [Candidatus Nanoarchaeia archaeon]
MKKTIPFSKKEIQAALAKHPTPFHIYDEKGIRATAKELNDAFRWSKGFRNYFAVKALPNPEILKILKEEGMGADCSSYAELVLAEKSGFKKEEIIFSSNNTSLEEYREAKKIGAYINVDDFSHLEVLEALNIIPETIFFRYNPGREFIGNSIIGKPREAKFGMTKEQIISSILIMKKRGTKRFGLHAMIASNELDEEHFIKVARMLFLFAQEIRHRTKETISIINLGGGIGIPYKPEEKEVNLKKIGEGIKKEYGSIIKAGNHPEIKLCMECGRAITGPHGFLISKVRNVSQKHKSFAGLDANMSDLMRPAIYGAYHHITVLGKENSRSTETYDVTGSLCENNDKFAVDRKLPVIERGDIMIIHDTGAHGHAMGFNYNGKLRSAELLMQQNRKIRKIRRAETLKDHFATLNI